MGTELDTVRLHLPDFGEAEHLESATIGQDRVRPVNEPVQSAGLADDFNARTDGKMVGVPEDDLRPHLTQLARIKRLDAALCADRHEDGRIDDTARRG